MSCSFPHATILLLPSGWKTNHKASTNMIQPSSFIRVPLNPFISPVSSAMIAVWTARWQRLVTQSEG